MGHRAVVRRLLGLAASIGLASCAVTDPTQYYTLGQPAAGSAESAGQRVDPARVARPGPAPWASASDP